MTMTISGLIDDDRNYQIEIAENEGMIPARSDECRCPCHDSVITRKLSASCACKDERKSE